MVINENDLNFPTIDLEGLSTRNPGDQLTSSGLFVNDELVEINLESPEEDA